MCHTILNLSQVVLSLPWITLHRTLLTKVFLVSRCYNFNVNTVNKAINKYQIIYRPSWLCNFRIKLNHKIHLTFSGHLLKLWEGKSHVLDHWHKTKFKHCLFFAFCFAFSFSFHAINFIDIRPFSYSHEFQVNSILS